MGSKSKKLRIKVASQIAGGIVAGIYSSQTMYDAVIYAAKEQKIVTVAEYVSKQAFLVADEIIKQAQKEKPVHRAPKTLEKLTKSKLYPYEETQR